MAINRTHKIGSVERFTRNVLAAGFVVAILFISPGCETPAPKPKPTAVLAVEKPQVQSGEGNRVILNGTIGGDPAVDRISDYYLRGPVDFGASLPLQTSIPIDVFLTYYTDEEMLVPLEAQVESNKGVLSNKVYASYQVNPEVVNPKPNALFEITPLEGESPLTVRVRLDSSLPDNTLEYILEGSVDTESVIPLSQETPVDRYLTYENTTEAPVTKTLNAKVKSDKGVFSDEVSISFTVNPQVIEDYINLSGIVEDNETDSPVANAEVRFYRPDRSLIATTIANSSGAWTADWLKYEGDDKIIIQAGAPPNYFVRTTSIPNQDNSSVLVRAVPNDLEGFLEFAQQVWGSLPARFDSTGFQGFKILTQNPTGNGTFTPEQAQYLRDLALDSSNNISMILNISSYPAVIDPSEPYAPGSRNLYVIPDTDISIGSAYLNAAGEDRVSIGGVIRMNPTNVSDWVLRNWLLHETGHLIYPSHTSNPESIMSYPASSVNEYQPLDLKGTYISNEPTYIGTAGGLYPNSIDYRKNILKTDFGLDGTIGY